MREIKTPSFNINDMAINKKLIHFNDKQAFESELAKGNILPYSIVFIKSTKELWTHGQYYSSLQDYYTKTEIDQNKANIDDLSNILGSAVTNESVTQKEFQLKERSTNQNIYPITLTEFIKNSNDKNLVDQLIPEGGQDKQVLYWKADGEAKWETLEPCTEEEIKGLFV